MPSRCDELCSLVACNCARVKANVVEKANMIKKIGKDDPRRIIHSVKVGSALSLVSLLYYFRPLYNGFGEAGMSAILTVVLVFEFTVGGTLSKSLNRGCATLAAGSLGLGAAYLSTLGGDKGGQVIIGVLVFLLATAATFIRFFPNVKSKYDYGVMIFILTFSLVAVTGSRVDEILPLAYTRLLTVLIGATTCIVISIFVCPVWAGQDFTHMLAGNIEKLADFLQGIGNDFQSFGEIGVLKESHDTRTFLTGYKSVLNSKAVEDTLANFSSWEPPHGRFGFGFPWKQYLKIGVLNRECAIEIELLGRYIIDSKLYQVPVSPEFHLKFQKPCARMSIEACKALEELSHAIRNMSFPSLPAVAIHIQYSKAAADELQTNIMLTDLLLPKHDLQETMQLFLVASTLIDIIRCIEKISVSVNELALSARFKKSKAREEKMGPRGVIEVNKDCVIVHIPRASGE
ncbi:hypothetical protein CASFOL_027190 [Castilleja foliolosa]|uniref:Aluminum-activated malate transporter n=1 Tax=Castilleja foliolosa TaxID=1961234 RepID=A0ABD3CFS6_9LAMI